MGSFLLLACGLFGGGVIFLLWKKAGRWHQWILAIGLYLWICSGVSFVYINAVGYHHKATAMGITFFGVVAAAWAFLVARAMGLVAGKKREAQE